MGKWGKYLKHYNKKWEENTLKDWLQPSSEDDFIQGKPEAYCKVCKCHLRAHHSDLILHSGTGKHTEKMKSLNRKEQKDVRSFGVTISDQSKLLDLKLAVFVAMHCAVKSMDHLCELLKSLGKGTIFENIKLHRTNCSRLISNIIAPAFLDELVKDIGTSKYAIIADESTDVSVTKFLALCVRYYSKSKTTMATEFLGLIQVTNCTGKILAKAFKEYLAKIKLELKQLRSIGTDGAANMCGEYNSFFAELKKDLPDLELIKCICHSIDKCAEYAFKEMPESLSFILHEVPSWFAHSAKRWNEYVVFYMDTTGNKTAPKKCIKMCKTRWLVCLPAAGVIVDQWSILRDFFNKQGDLRAKALTGMLNDNANFSLHSSGLCFSALKRSTLPSRALMPTSPSFLRTYNLLYSLLGHAF